ncbi:VOC family protein [Streptomyces inhibens]|uniref:VOC family protein n=1 Tax=Streptomyces inhibens TaxID=2293571 RepID=UPI001EE7030A|nr:VOC family protein [Streptomyces inhibens]UKY50870.1 VOC family protein [Streptomyces inhibens]
MSEISTNQPLGTPTWIDLAVPDLDRAKVFYRALFGWEYAERSTATGPFTMCLLRGRRVAALRAASAADVEGESWWHMYLATDDCDATAKRITDGGGTLLAPPSDVADLGRTAVVADPVGARFSLWQGRTLPGCELVNEPCTLVRNDLVAPAPGPARRFYTGAFDFTLDGNDTLPPDFDFTFLRRPDGHEVGGVFGDPAAPAARWQTVFEVADTDDLVARAVAAGGTAGTPSDLPYGRIAEITDPFGTVFNVITRPAAA